LYSSGQRHRKGLPFFLDIRLDGRKTIEQGLDLVGENTLFLDQPAEGVQGDEWTVEGRNQADSRLSRTGHAAGSADEFFIYTEKRWVGG
jgi:hypothetical protein